jgi:predicted MFS family arabinose efflux permease
MFGVGVAIGAFIVAGVGMHHDNRCILAFLYAIQASGVAISAVWPNAAGLAIGSLLVGLPFTAIVAFTMREARRLWGSDASRLIGLTTAVYALGQVAGPPMTTALVARTGGFGVALAIAAGALLIGSIRIWRCGVRRLSPAARLSDGCYV